MMCIVLMQMDNEKALGYVFYMGDITILHCGDAVATDRLVTDVCKAGLFILFFCQSMAEIGLESHVILLVI